MAVKIVITKPPVVTAPVHSTYKGTTIYNNPPAPEKTFPTVIPLSQTPALVVNPAVGLSYLRNNRVVGYFCDVVQARLHIDWVISRETEFGADI